MLPLSAPKPRMLFKFLRSFYSHPECCVCLSLALLIQLNPRAQDVSCDEAPEKKNEDDDVTQSGDWKENHNLE